MIEFLTNVAKHRQALGQLQPQSEPEPERQEEVVVRDSSVRLSIRNSFFGGA